MTLRPALVAGLLLTCGTAPCRAAMETIPDGLTVTPAVRTLYDSNILNTNSERRSGPRSDLRVTPSIDVTLRRLFGRHLLTLTGSAGYDFNRRFSFLNRERINMAAKGDIAIEANCHAIPTANLNFAQSNLSDQGTITGNSARAQNYGLALSCKRDFGLYPFASGTYSRTDNSAASRKVLDTETLGYSGGFGYRKPSIGDLLFTVGYQRFRRPNLQAELDVPEGAQTSRYALLFTRNVAPRLSWRAGINYFVVTPKASNVRKFHGLGFEVGAQYRPSPRLGIDLDFERAARNESNTASTYVIEETYTLSGFYIPSQRSQVSFGGSLDRRTFRGELGIDTDQLRGDDSTKSVFVGYNYTVHSRLQTGLQLRREWRDAANRYFEYASSSAMLTIGLKL